MWLNGRGSYRQKIWYCVLHLCVEVPLSYNKSNLEMLTLADMYIYRPFLHWGSFANRM